MHPLIALIQSIVNPQPAARQMNMSHHAQQRPPMTDRQRTLSNTTIAADAARMYSRAHGGQQYTLGQNGESLEGGIDPQLLAYYQAHGTSPLVAKPRYTAPQFSMPQMHQAFDGALNLAQSDQLGGDDGTPIQGQQNVGLIPMQGSRGNVIPQNAYPDLNRKINIINSTYRSIR